MRRAPGLLALVAVAACEGGSDRRPAADPPAVAAFPDAPDARYLEIVRPILTRHGCDAGPCHGTFRGGGLYLSSGAEAISDYQTVVSRVDRTRPRDSELLRKGFGEVQHNGGKNLAADECDARHLIAWIAGEPDPACTAAAPEGDDFAATVAPALVEMGCTANACHGGADTAAAHALDLGPGRAQASIERSGMNAAFPWMSPVIAAANGDAVHAAMRERLPCAYRRLYGWVAGAPGIACDPASRAPLPGPSLAELASTVMPGLARRGCLESSCHGGGTNPMSLYDPAAAPHLAYHDWLMLTARVEDLDHIDDSTLLRTLRNSDPHGGGARLGGAGDCLDAMLVGWLRGAPVAPCGRREPPRFERFRAEVQPVLDRMTCTRAACHGAAIEVFRVTPAGDDEAALRANYTAVLREIDYDFTPLSAVMLRMREPCAYAVTTAWIEGRARPDCELRDPDPKIFPRVGHPDPT